MLDPSVAVNSDCKSTLYLVRDILRKGNTEVLLYRQAFMKSSPDSFQDIPGRGLRIAQK